MTKDFSEYGRAQPGAGSSRFGGEEGRTSLQRVRDAFNTSPTSFDDLYRDSKERFKQEAEASPEDINRHKKHNPDDNSASELDYEF